MKRFYYVTATLRGSNALRDIKDMYLESTHCPPVLFQSDEKTKKCKVLFYKEISEDDYLKGVSLQEQSKKKKKADWGSRKAARR